MVKTGQAVAVLFATANATTGAAADADSLPAGVLYVDGTANAATVTVANITTGLYKASVTLPALTAGQLVSLKIAATVSTVAGVGVIWQDTADTYLVSDIEALVDDIGVAGAGLTAIPWNAAWDAEVQSECTDALNAYDPPTYTELSTLLSAASVTVTSPVTATGDLEIYQGDGYLVAKNRQLEFAVVDASHYLGLDGVTCTVKLYLEERTWTAASVTSTDTGYTVVVAPTYAQTALLTHASQAFRLKATYTGTVDAVTLKSGRAVLVTSIAEVTA
jgi:hypothetical protein